MNGFKTSHISGGAESGFKGPTGVELSFLPWVPYDQMEQKSLPLTRDEIHEGRAGVQLGIVWLTHFGSNTQFYLFMEF